MAKKKKDVKVKKKDVKIVDKIVESGEAMVPKAVEDNENSTLIWFLVIVGVVFAMVLVPYFWVESSKTFNFGGINWTIENYEYLEIFHGRFLSLTNPNLHYNIFLRNDPRENDVKIVGELDSFKYGGIISLSRSVDACRGDLSRVMLDLSAFLKQGVGVGMIESGSSDEEIANQSGRRFANCRNVDDRTVVIIDLGEDVGIVQDEENPFCYTITARDCEDSRTVEKFIIDSVEDFRNK